MQPVPGTPGSPQVFPVIGPSIGWRSRAECVLFEASPTLKRKKKRVNWVINTLLLFHTQHLETSLYFMKTNGGGARNGSGPSSKHKETLKVR